MGDAVKMSERLLRLRAEQPFCIYCGGTTEGTTVDHMPPISFFDRRVRPKGHEFLACVSCNNGASDHEKIVAALSRLFPDATDPVLLEEMERLLTAVDRSNPGLIRSMLPSLKQELDARRLSRGVAHAVDISHPRIHEAVLKVGAKLGFALHYEATKRIVPPNGAVAVAWFSNHDIAVGKFPDLGARLLEQAKTLMQGRLTSKSIFEYGSVLSDDKQRSAHAIAFRQAFNVAVFVTEDKNTFENKPVANIFQPGFLLTDGKSRKTSVV